MNHPVGVSFSLQQASDLAAVEDFTMLAENLGFGSVWIPEAWGRDAFTLLAVLATRTTSIQLATGIVNVFSRTPAIVAQSIASLDDISGGRAILGLGASGPRVIERWHGLKFENILTRSREFVDVVRLILSGETVNYSGEVYRLSDFSLGFKPPRTTIPIYLAAIGPANVRLAGQIADGWLPIFASESFLDAAASWLRQGAGRAGRRVGDVVTASYIPALVGPDGVELVKRHLAFYVGGMGSYYYRLIVRGGWKREADAIRRCWRSGDKAGAIHAVSDALVDAVAITGDAQRARQRLAQFRKTGVDLPVVSLPHGSGAESIRATLEALGGG